MRIVKSKQYRAYARMQKRRAHKIKNHPFIVPVVTFLGLFFLTTVGIIFLNAQTVGAGDAHVVQLSIDGVPQELPTRVATVGELLKRLDIKPSKKDIIEPPLDTPILEDNFKINIYHARPVIVIDGSRKVAFLSAEPSLRSVAQKAGVKLYPEDEVNLANPDASFEQGIISEKIVVDHATPVKLNLYGRTLSLRTHAETVQDLLEERGVDKAKFSVFPSLSTKLKQNSIVFVTNPGQKVTLKEVTIPQGETTVDDFNLPLGTSRVRSDGQPGVKVLVYAVDKKDPSKKTFLEEILISKPVNRVVVRGRKITNTFGGGFETALAALRGCEAGGNYANKNNPNYRGAYQFAWSTWASYGGYKDPADAPPLIQDQRATETYQARGWQPWPSCSVNLGLQDIYR